MKKKNLAKIATTAIVTIGLLVGCSNKSNLDVTGQENIGTVSNGSGTSRGESVASGTLLGALLGAAIAKVAKKDPKVGAVGGAVIGAAGGDILYKKSNAAAKNEQAYSEAEKTNNEESNRLNRTSTEMENTMGSPIR